MNLLGAVGMAKPVSEFINTGINVQHSRDQSALAGQQRKLNEIKLAQDERNNEWLDVSEVLTKAQEKGHGGAIDLGIKRQMELGLHKEAPGADGTKRTFMRRSDISSGVSALESDTKAQPAILADREAYLTSQMDTLEKKAGDPKFKAQYDELATERRMVRKKLYGLDEQDKGQVVPAGATLVRPGQENFTAPKEPEPTKTRTIEEGDTKRTEEWVNGAWKEIATAPRYKPTTNVNVDVDMGLSKGARAKAEEDVQESTDMYKGLENLVAISKPEFFTYKGQIQAGAERLGEKAGIVKDPKLLKDYSQWKVGTEQEFNKYRKWATGVAAGEKELERLAGSFPNINMSKTQYLSAAKQTAVNAWKLAERRRRALNAGINDPGKQKDFYRLLPLDSMPDPPADVIQRFSPKSKFEIIGVE